MPRVTPAEGPVLNLLLLLPLPREVMSELQNEQKWKHGGRMTLLSLPWLKWTGLIHPLEAAAMIAPFLQDGRVILNMMR